MDVSRGLWPKNYLGMDVFEAAVERMVEIYAAGHRVVISMSGGKDSTVAFEVCRIAARATNRLPLEVVMRDDEIMYPGTYEYLERVRDDPEVSFTWLITHYAEQNIYDRGMPLYWPYDPNLDQGDWVRWADPRAEYTPWPFMSQMTNLVRYPVERGKHLHAVMGLRAAESLNRMRGTFASGGHVTRVDRGIVNCKPLYDWTDRDVWRAVREFEWDYNRSYDYLATMGVPRQRQRVAPPAGMVVSAKALRNFATTHPEWFARVELRVGEGLGRYRETGSGAGVWEPDRRGGESWEKCFWRCDVDDAPTAWISQRSNLLVRKVLHEHELHRVGRFPEVAPCEQCDPQDPRSWKEMAERLWTGDHHGYTSLGQPLLDTLYDRPWREELLARGSLHPAPGRGVVNGVRLSSLAWPPGRRA